jgi:predicted ribosome-associated RNA-binding protein Tma20
MRPGLISLESNAQMGERVLIVSVKGEVVALANLLVEPSTIATMVTGEVAKPDLVLMDEGTYPKGWVN